jgi:hypothetical protein
VALLAGFIDSMAGGGGLLALPALPLAQVPPVAALGTNKLQSSFGSLTAALGMLRRGIVRFEDMRGLFVASLFFRAGHRLFFLLSARSIFVAGICWMRRGRPR